ncbi:hypothetical protein BBK14_27765 [Parafrankia soli]|uniref:Biotin carboxyl carrier protein of acetyl-CoA carboxylase n=1 Tax=Parafrankia soli TaxID=2599596 RepID=A0A1S1PGZ4_9ACTN|nr:biotin/lipoyl-containing protein [Parafrankia soli]OHV20511.1 hypothetical protein BBK14_27765 [Parafrankia soli]
MRESLLEVLARLAEPPKSLRLATGAITIEISWDRPGPAGADDAVGRGATGDRGRVNGTGGANGAGATGSAGGVRAAAGAPAHPDQPATADPDADYLRSPAVGVFYRAPKPGAEPFVSVGSTVAPGQQVGIVEAMKLMIPIEADRGGTIREVVKADREPVEFDEPLFVIDVDETIQP